MTVTSFTYILTLLGTEYVIYNTSRHSKQEKRGNAGVVVGRKKCFGVSSSFYLSGATAFDLAIILRCR